MIVREAFAAAFREIRTNPVRSVLSFAAVSVGVASLLFTLAQTRGIQKAFVDAVSLMGPGRIDINAKEGYVSRGLSPGLTADDAAEIRALMPELYMVYPVARNWRMSLREGKEKLDVQVHGVTPEWPKRDWVYTLRGRFLNDWDVEHGERVCVAVEPGGWIKKPFWAYFWLRAEPYDDFATHHDLLGRRVLLDERVFTVVGVLKEPPKDKDPRWFSWGGADFLVPVTTYQALFGGSRGREGDPHAVESITVDTGDAKTLPAAKRQIEEILKRRHRGEEDFELKDMVEEIQGELNEHRRVLIAAITLGAVALLAGGIGIMNVTLAATYSRIKEIGIRRALGAERSDILGQFVAEAMLLGVAGGLAGIALGWWAIDYLAKTSDRDIAKLAWHHGLSAMGAAVAVCALFSLYPAYQASRLDPVEALRSE